MRKTTLAAIAALATAGLASSAAAEVIYLENFDGSGTLPLITEDTDGNPVAQFTDGGGDYFTVTDGSTIGGAVTFTNPSGNFFAAQDTDGDGAPSPLRLRIDGIDVSGYTNLQLSIDFAEDDDGTAQDWDEPDFVHANLSLDTVAGGADNDPSLFGIWLENDGSEFNSAPFIDADFDGTGEGAEITDTFTTYSQSFTQTGSTAGILITIALNSGDEDVAIDNITLTGDLVPEPASLALLGVAGLGLLRRRA